jgi:23S rRNA (pseudouridine1915-N3)-methyltransferase
VGKTDTDYLKAGIEEYYKRLSRYIDYEMKVLPDIRNSKNMSETLQKENEGKLILGTLAPSDYVSLLDENGKIFSSVEFSDYLVRKMLGNIKRLVFVIGGPYGFSEEIYNRANDKISLSKMTFSHQMVRMIFTEQLYRAMTIIKGEPYHHK